MNLLILHARFLLRSFHAKALVMYYLFMLSNTMFTHLLPEDSSWNLEHFFTLRNSQST